MKILFLTDDFPPRSFGGAGIVAFNQAHELSKRGYKVVIITTTDKKELQGEIVYEGMIVHMLYTDYSPRFRAYNSIYNPQVVSQVEKIIQSLSPDVVHAHNIHQRLSYHSLYIAKKYSPKLILTMHDAMSVHYSKLFPKMQITLSGQTTFDYRVSVFDQIRNFRFRWNPFRNILIKYYLNCVDEILAVSIALAEALKQNGVQVNRVLYNGIESATVQVQDNAKVVEFKKKWNLEDKKILFFGGRISRAKGGNVALRLLVDVLASEPATCLLIAGVKDEYVETLMKEANVRGLRDRVIITGWLDRRDMAMAYESSDIVLTLSLYMDPFPTVNLEAMSARKPILGTCFGGTPEAVQNGVTGCIVNPFDSEAVRVSGERLLKDSRIRRTYGDAGFLRIQNEFSLSKQIDELLDIYGSGM